MSEYAEDRASDTGDELLPEQSADDTDAGWGERPDVDTDDDRLTREKPPHS